MTTYQFLALFGILSLIYSEINAMNESYTYAIVFLTVGLIALSGAFITLFTRLP